MQIHSRPLARPEFNPIRLHSRMRLLTTPSKNDMTLWHWCWPWLQYIGWLIIMIISIIILQVTVAIMAFLHIVTTFVGIIPRGRSCCANDFKPTWGKWMKHLRRCSKRRVNQDRNPSLVSILPPTLTRLDAWGLSGTFFLFLVSHSGNKKASWVHISGSRAHRLNRTSTWWFFASFDGFRQQTVRNFYVNREV